MNENQLEISQKLANPYNKDLISQVFGNSIAKTIAEVRQSSGVGADQWENWVEKNLLEIVMPQGLFWSSRLIDEVLPEEFRQVISHPSNADHGLQHSYMASEDFMVAVALDPELARRNYNDRNDVIFAGLGAIVSHDWLQVLTKRPDKKRLGHDEIGARFLIPGLMKLGNLMGLTDYSDRQIAIAVALGFNHESEHDYVGKNMPSNQDLLKFYEGEQGFGQKITEVFPVIKWLRDELLKKTNNSFDLLKFEPDFSEIDDQLIEIARNLFTAADLRGQIAPPFRGAMRALGTFKDRKFADMSIEKQVIEPGEESINQYPVYKKYIDYIVSNPGYDPYNSSDEHKKEFPNAPERPEDDLGRAVFETARGAQDFLPLHMKAWAASSQRRRGDWQILTAKDMGQTYIGGKPNRINNKYYQLALLLEKELVEEQRIKTSELSDLLAGIMDRFQLLDLYNIHIGEKKIEIGIPELQELGGYLVKEYADTVMLLLYKLDVMSKAEKGKLDLDELVNRVETVIGYAQEKSGMRAPNVINPQIRRIEKQMRLLVGRFSRYVVY